MSNRKISTSANNFHSFVYLGALSIFVIQVLAINDGQLGLRLNDGLANHGKYAYDAIAQFQDDILATWTDEQIVGIAQQAYLDMQAMFNSDQRRFHTMTKPAVITVIVTGHSVYLSFSLKGGESFLYIPNANTQDNRLKWTPGVLDPARGTSVVTQALLNCQAKSTNNSGHRSGANCGEPMAAMAFVQTNPGGKLDGAKVVTWGKFKDQTNAWTTGVMDPCRK